MCEQLVRIWLDVEDSLKTQGRQRAFLLDFTSFFQDPLVRMVSCPESRFSLLPVPEEREEGPLNVFIIWKKWSVTWEWQSETGCRWFGLIRNICFLPLRRRENSLQSGAWTGSKEQAAADWKWCGTMRRLCNAAKRAAGFAMLRNGESAL